MLRTLIAIGCIALPGLVVPLAHAGDLYVCKDAHGNTAYQDHPCPPGATTLDQRQYKSTPYAPPPVLAPAEPVAGPEPQPPAPAPAPAAPAPPPPTVGWVCQAGSRTWLQFEPCPASYDKPAAMDVNGVVDGTTTHLSGTGTVMIPTPVRATALDQAGVCAALADHSIGIPHHGTGDVYERGLLRSKYDCR